MTAVFRERWQFLEPYFRGKTVLDIGPAELVGTSNRHKLEKTWLHARIKSVAAHVVGLEKNPEQVEALTRLGYNIVQGDAESFDLGAQFDVVFAGELIEHLSNPGLFLECAKRHLKPDGVLLLTTPNRFSAAHFVSAFMRNRIPEYEKAIAKHVCYFDENSLRDLLIRHGFSGIAVHYAEWVGKPIRSKGARILNAFLRKYRPKFLRIILVAAHPDG